jgi:TnpA family transposase
MKKHEILSPQTRSLLFDPPTDPISIVRHYTLSADDMAIVRRRRRDANRLGFAVNLAYLRFPGRTAAPIENPPWDMLRFIGEQIGVSPTAFPEYAQRDETRWEHLGELYQYLGVRPFVRSDYRATVRVALHEAAGTDRGDAIVAGMITYLRQQSILLPAAPVLERLALVARATARKQAYKALVTGLKDNHKAGLEALLTVTDDKGRTGMAWLREWSEAPTQKNLAALVERLQMVRGLDIQSDREQLIHRARYTAIARETSILSAQHLSRFDDQRRMATLVVFLREMEAVLTDGAIAMLDKMMGSIFRRADHKHKERVVDRAKILDVSMRSLLDVAKALIVARDTDADQSAVIERVIGWSRLAEVVGEMETILGDGRQDNLGEVIASFPTVHRIARVVLDAFMFRSWKEQDPVLVALETVRELHKSGRRDISSRVPVSFMTPLWRKLVTPNGLPDRKAYEVAVMVHLRDRLRSGDVWVEGSRSFRAFDDYLLPVDAFAIRRKQGDLGLAVPDDFTAWRQERIITLENRLREVEALAMAGELPEAIITEEGLSMSPIRREEIAEAEDVTRRLYGMLPRLRITEVFAEVHEWTGFADRFGHMRTGEAPADIVALMTAVLADATNLGLSRMARSSGNLTHSRLLWTAEWHIRDETYAAGLACLTEAIHAQPMSEVWGDGETSSSDGQFFRAGGHGEARADHNSHYGSDAGVKFYTHISDRYAPFYTKVIAANASEAAHVLDGLLHHETSLAIKEHYTDTGGVAEHVFGLCHLLGFRFAPRIRDLGERKLSVPNTQMKFKALEPMIGGTANLSIIAESWDETIRLAASIRAGTVAPSAMLRRLSAYPRQNALAKALREIGRIERTHFTLDWITDPALRRRANAGLNKGEARNALSRTLFFHRQGEIRDRTFENQRYRASGLNLAVAAVILWNTVYLSRAVAEIRSSGETVRDDLLTHIAPLGWEHISFNGDYVWPTESLKDGFRPLRNSQASILDRA